MDTAGRRERILEILGGAGSAVSASALARRLGVSRQVIVTDVAILRAGDCDILATPRGYVLNGGGAGHEVVFKAACLHDALSVMREIYAVVDNGGRLVDVIVEHPLYGQLSGQLNIASRYDADEFLSKVEGEQINLLSELTDGAHLHTVACADEETAGRIRAALLAAGILLT